MPPETAPSHEDLVAAIPPDLFRGDLAGENRAENDEASVYYDFVFLKNEDADQVPMRIALYAKQGTALVRRFVAPTPFAPGDCRRGECRARIAPVPDGFQISRESFGADRLRADYRFVVDGNDLELIGKGFQAKAPGGGKACALFYDYRKGRILRRSPAGSGTEPLRDAKASHLIADGVRFEAVAPADVCAPPKP